MQIKVKTFHPDGSVSGEFTYGPNEVQFVLEVGTNFLLMNGASPYQEDDEEEDTFTVPGPQTAQ